MGDLLLDGKICVVTGGTQGLGEGIARRIADAGAGGVVICGRSVEKGGRVAAQIETGGCPSVFVRADLTVESECREVIHRCVDRFGRIDGLVNAAGTTGSA